MSIKSKISKFLLGTMSALTMLGSVTSVYAASPTVYEEYDDTRLGSITLYKYVNNDGVTIESSGIALGNNTAEQLEAIQNATGNYHMLPEKGVTFMYFHIGNYKQVSTDKTTQMYVTDLNSDFLNMLTTYGITLQGTSNGYESDEVQEAMEKLCKATTTAQTGEEAARQFVKTNGAYFTNSTNDYGKTVIDGLSTGLYMVAEVDWEHQSIAKHDTYWQRTEGTEDAGDGSAYADIVSPSSPFLVQLPITNTVDVTSGGKTYSAGTGWIYDITAYPKNGTLNIHKDIVVNMNGDGKDNDGMDTVKSETLCDYAQINYINNNSSDYEQGYDDDTQLDGDNKSYLTHQIDVSMGDTVRQVISSDVPALVEGKLNKTYKITDNMTQGLTFTQVNQVTLGTGVWNDASNSVLTADTDYTVTVSDDKTTFTVELTASGLAKLDAIPSASYLYVDFDAVLNNKAMIGTKTYQYTTNDGNTVDATNQNTAMLTYATDRTGEHDYYSNTCRVYTYEMDVTKNIPKLKDDEDYSSVRFTMTGEVKKDDSTTFEEIQFIKDGEGEYHIYDGTCDDANAIVKEVACSAEGKLVIKGMDARDYVLTEIGTVSGYNLLASPVSIRMQGHKLYDDDSRYLENGALDHVYIWSGDEPEQLKGCDLAEVDGYTAQLSKGIAPFLITNEGTSILRTGGTGNLALRIAGGTILGLAICMYIVKKKKEEEK